MAEAILREQFARAGVADVVVRSTGISDEEAGNPVDARAAEALRASGYEPPAKHKARLVTGKDLAKTDLVLPMTAYHARAVRNLAKKAGAEPEIRMMRAFDPAAPVADDYEDEHLLDVDDPWYGGEQDFAECMAALLAAAPGVVDYVRDQIATN